MKQFIYAIAILCTMFFVSSCKNEISSDNKKFGLNRTVKSVQVKTYVAENKFGEIFKGELSHKENYLAFFDAKGNLTSITEFDEDGDMVSKTIYEYDDNNHITKQTNYNRYGNVTSFSEMLYQGEYIIKYKSVVGDNIFLSEYQRNGSEIQEYTFTKNEVLVSKRKYKYLESSKTRHLYVEYDETGKEIQTVQSDFDKKGNILKETISRGKEVESTSYSYNKAGYMTGMSTSSGKSGEVRYNEKNLPIYANGAFLNHNTDVFLHPNLDYLTPIYYFEYEYDNKGNWIKQIVYEGEMKEPYTISERVINY